MSIEEGACPYLVTLVDVWLKLHYVYRGGGVSLLGDTIVDADGRQILRHESLLTVALDDAALKQAEVKWSLERGLERYSNRERGVE